MWFFVTYITKNNFTCTFFFNLDPRFSKLFAILIQKWDIFPDFVYA